MMNEDTSIKRSTQLLRVMRKRHSVRSFTKAAIPEKVIINCISIAASAPSGANMQPWSFVLVSDATTKKLIREKAEEIEQKLYSDIISEEWKTRLKPLQTNARKAFLEEAPYLICVFLQRYGLDNAGNEIKHYYAVESVGIATGFLIAALHQLGISVLTYTPSPMSFLTEILQRPVNEKPFIILAVGYPDKNHQVPSLMKKARNEYLTIIK